MSTPSQGMKPSLQSSCHHCIVSSKSLIKDSLNIVFKGVYANDFIISGFQFHSILELRLMVLPECVGFCCMFFIQLSSV